MDHLRLRVNHGGATCYAKRTDMPDKPDCGRCRRIRLAIDQGLPPNAAREENGWDECPEDDCPMQPVAYGFKTVLSFDPPGTAT